MIFQKVPKLAGWNCAIWIISLFVCTFKCAFHFQSGRLFNSMTKKVGRVNAPFLSGNPLKYWMCKSDWSGSGGGSRNRSRNRSGIIPLSAAVSSWREMSRDEDSCQTAASCCKLPQAALLAGWMGEKRKRTSRPNFLTISGPWKFVLRWPDRPFHKFRALNQEIDSFFLVQVRHTTDFQLQSCDRIDLSNLETSMDELRDSKIAKRSVGL